MGKSWARKKKKKKRLPLRRETARGSALALPPRPSDPPPR
jgi:hypothetical protein